MVIKSFFMIQKLILN